MFSLFLKSKISNKLLQCLAPALHFKFKIVAFSAVIWTDFHFIFRGGQDFFSDFKGEQSCGSVGCPHDCRTKPSQRSGHSGFFPHFNKFSFLK